MFNTDNGYSLSDIAAASGTTDGFGGNGAWWIIILFLFCFMGGWGNYGTSGTGAATAATAAGQALTRQDLCMDMNFSDLKHSVDGVKNGIYEGFSSVATQNVAGQNAIQQTVMTGFADANVSRMNNMNTLNSNINSTQRAIENGFAQTNYNMATDTCSTNHAIQTSSTALGTQLSASTRDIVDSNNAGVQAILEKLNQQELNAKDAQISALTQQVNALNLAASQQAQNSYLIDQLGQKAAIPAYVVSSPYASYNYSGCCSCGVNS